MRTKSLAQSPGKLSVLGVRNTCGLEKRKSPWAIHGSPVGKRPAFFLQKERERKTNKQTVSHFISFSSSFIILTAAKAKPAYQIMSLACLKALNKPYGSYIQLHDQPRALSLLLSCAVHPSTL